MCATLNDSHARCCRVIRLSQREHLLLRRFDKAANWCEELNGALRDRGMRVFLFLQRWEVHVKGVLNFDYTRTQILMVIRKAAAWWEEQRKCRVLLSRSLRIQSKEEVNSPTEKRSDKGVNLQEDNDTYNQTAKLTKPTPAEEPKCIPKDYVKDLIAKMDKLHGKAVAKLDSTELEQETSSEVDKNKAQGTSGAITFSCPILYCTPRILSCGYPCFFSRIQS